LMNKRNIALDALLRFEQPIDRLEASLAGFPWDAVAEVAWLSSTHITSVLNRFLTGRISAVEVEAWANAIEGRDDIGLDRENEQLLRRLVHELANPLLTQPLTRERAIDLLRDMESER
jgi:hypothetical protein